MASDNGPKKFKNISPAGHIALCLLAILLAAAICAYGCFVIILKGPFESYRAPFVKHICTETVFGPVVRQIMGDDAVSQIVGVPAAPEEEASK